MAVRRRRIKTDIVTAPSHWASALVNGDVSGIDTDEDVYIDRWVEQLTKKGWTVVDVVRDKSGEPNEPRFTWHYRMYGGNAQGGDVLDYVVHKLPSQKRR